MSIIQASLAQQLEAAIRNRAPLLVIKLIGGERYQGRPTRLASLHDDLVLMMDEEHGGGNAIRVSAIESVEGPPALYIGGDYAGVPESFELTL